MTEDAPRDEDRERVQLSLAQIIASSLAAVSAAVICSFFGVAGTVIGTAAASIVATIGSALYGYSLRRTRARLRRLHQAGAAAPPLTEVVKTARQQGQRIWSQLPARVLAIGIVVVFVISMGIVTVIELGAGKPLSDIVRNSQTDSGTSLVPHKKAAPSPSATTSPSPKPKPKPTPTTTPTRSPSPTTTPTPSATTTPSAVLPSLLPSAKPTASQ